MPSWPEERIKKGEVSPPPEPGKCNSICARDPFQPPTWENVRKHLTWAVTGSPFISFFTSFECAWRWKERYIREGACRVRIFCFNAQNVATLLDGNTLANELGITTDKVGTRHAFEYLVWGWISGAECAGVFDMTC
ncbi:MAG: hypothetical protein CMP47_09500 [Rickettsiales bacterium]|nr:hypothetical protein [Rickettsiales bacterium]